MLLLDVPYTLAQCGLTSTPLVSGPSSAAATSTGDPQSSGPVPLLGWKCGDLVQLSNDGTDLTDATLDTPVYFYYQSMDQILMPGLNRLTYRQFQQQRAAASGATATFDDLYQSLTDAWGQTAGTSGQTTNGG